MKTNKNTLFFAIILLNISTAYTGTPQVDSHEKFADKVEVVAIAVKDVVSDTADTVKRGMQAGAEYTKSFIASTAAKIKIALQEARAKQAEKRAQDAREENQKVQRTLAETQEQLKLAQAALQQAQKAMYQKN
jgi:hypothetical protein